MNKIELTRDEKYYRGFVYVVHDKTGTELRFRTLKEVAEAIGVSIALVSRRIKTDRCICGCTVTRENED